MTDSTGGYPFNPETGADWSPEELSTGEAAWIAYESTEERAKRWQRAKYLAEVRRNIRDVMAVLRRMGWPGRWPRELMLTHRGRE